MAVPVRRFEWRTVKTLIAILSMSLVSLSANAQGTVNFANIAGGLNAPVFLNDGVTKVSGPDYVAALLAGPTASTLSQAATTPFLSGSSAGYFLNGGQQVFIPNIAPGGTAYILIEVWNSANFPNFAAAQSANLPNSWGWSGNGIPFTVTTGNPDGGVPGLPATLIGLTSFNLNAAVPEPSTLVLTGVGAALMLVFRRGSKLLGLQNGTATASGAARTFSMNERAGIGANHGGFVTGDSPN